MVSFSKRPPKMKTCKCFQHWFYFSCDLSVCEIHKSNFNTSPISRWPTCFLKYMKVILTLVLFSTDLLVCEIHESDFNIGLIFQVTYHFIKKTWKFFNIGLIVMTTYPIMKYMKVISTMVLFSRWLICLWNTWKWFQPWSYFLGDLPNCEINESDFNIGLIFMGNLPIDEKYKEFLGWSNSH